MKKYNQKYLMIKVGAILLVLGLMLMGVACSQDTDVSESEYLPPTNLHIAGFSGTGANRAVALAWDAPDTAYEVVQYAVYKMDAGADEDIMFENAIEVGRTADTNYEKILGNKDYHLYVVAIYPGDAQSGPGNVVRTAMDMADASGPVSGAGDDTDTEPAEETNNDTDLETRKDNGLDIGLESFCQDALGFCYNPYYPVALGAARTYQVTGASSPVTNTITDLSEDGFTETWVSPDSTIMQKWECLPEGLVNMSSAFDEETLAAVTDEIRVVGDATVEGISIPVPLNIGDSWEQTSSGAISPDDDDAKLIFTTTVSRTAVGMETVTVPAGTFEAIRVDSIVVMDSILDTPEGTLPFLTSTSAGSLWLAEGIGAVKITSGIVAEGKEIKPGKELPIWFEATITHELIAYELPDKD